MSIDSRLEREFDGAVYTILGPLLAPDYSYVPVKKMTGRVLGEHLVAAWESSGKRRSVRIAYIPKSQEHQDAISCTLRNLATDDLFSIAEYMKLKGIDRHRYELLELRLVEGPTVERIKACVGEHARFLKEQMMELLTNDRWEHVPIDWGDFK